MSRRPSKLGVAVLMTGLLLGFAGCGDQPSSGGGDEQREPGSGSSVPTAPPTGTNRSSHIEPIDDETCTSADDQEYPTDPKGRDGQVVCAHR